MNSDIWLPALIALAASAVPATIAVWAARRRNAAETESTIVATYHSVLEELRAELTRREADCTRRIEALERDMYRHIADLEGMIRTLGGHPPDRRWGGSPEGDVDSG